MGKPLVTLKFISLFVNVSTVTGSIALLALYGFIMHFYNVLPEFYATYLLFTFGLSLLIAIVGCYAIWKENVALTKAFLIMLLFSLFVQIIGKFIKADFKTVKERAENVIQEQWEKEIDTPGAMDDVQQMYQCCGKNRFEDYYDELRTIPNSCYNENDPQSMEYVESCLDAAYRFVDGFYDFTTVIEWVNILLTLIIFAFAFYLEKHFYEKQQLYNYN